MKPVEWFCGVFGACVGLLITIMIRSQFDSLADELAVLRESNDQLRRQLDHTEKQRKVLRARLWQGDGKNAQA